MADPVNPEGTRRMAMRRYLVLSVLGVCLLVFMPGTTASAGSSKYYAGKNSQGQKAPIQRGSDRARAKI